MIVLHTNVASEVMRPRPNPAVVEWLGGVGRHAALTSITVSELLAGAHVLPPGRRRSQLLTDLDNVIAPYAPLNRILPFDLACAREYGRVMEVSRRHGRPMSMADAQIAAICRRHQAALATRNVNDFLDLGVELINPWD